MYFLCMALKRVKQDHTCGCFVAAVATLLGVSYRTAFVRLYGKWSEYFCGVPQGTQLDPLLDKVGLKHRRVQVRRFERLKKNSLVVIEWHSGLCHTLVWDAEDNKVIDPFYASPLDLVSYQSLSARVTHVYEITGKQRRKAAKSPTRRRGASVPATSSRRPGSGSSARGRR